MNRIWCISAILAAITGVAGRRRGGILIIPLIIRIDRTVL